MNITKDRVVSIDYTLTGNDQKVIDSSEGGEPLTYLHGHGQLVPGLERALEGKAAGEPVKVSVPPEEGYGARDAAKIGPVPRAAFAKVGEVKPGMRFQAGGSDGVGMVTVVEVGDETITVDGNHPLAGETLHFDVTVRDVREATAEELSHGHVHGPGGHHH